MSVCVVLMHGLSRLTLRLVLMSVALQCAHQRQLTNTSPQLMRGRVCMTLRMRILVFGTVGRLPVCGLNPLGPASDLWLQDGMVRRGHGRASVRLSRESMIVYVVRLVEIDVGMYARRLVQLT